MAIQKEIQLENGIVVKYHRIASINKITNKANIIEVASYTNKEKRQEEINYYANNEAEKTMNVFIDTTYINKEYEENETIEEAYTYLKTLDKFKNAEDDL